MLFKRTEILPQYERTRFSSEPFQYTSYLGFGRFFKRTLPYADYLVPQKSEFERNFFVALYICFDFIAPKRLVGFRQVAFVANPASVPKASVHEYGNPVFRKDEIRMPTNLELRRHPMIPYSRNNATNLSPVLLFPFERILDIISERFFFDTVSIFYNII